MLLRGQDASGRNRNFKSGAGQSSQSNREKLDYRGSKMREEFRNSDDCYLD
jgi:hypothetical protein